MDEVPGKMMLDHEVKQANPWDVASIFEFNYFICPECDCKLQLKQEFINHASFHHPWVSWRFYQISIGYRIALNFKEYLNLNLYCIDLRGRSVYRKFFWARL